MAIAKARSVSVTQLADAGDGWTIANNSVGSPDGVSDSTTVAGTASKTLKFAFTSTKLVPANATITGIRVTITANASA